MADLFIGRRENSHGTAAFNAITCSGLRGNAGLEGCPGFVSQLDGRGAEGVSPRGVLHARPWPAVARETRSRTRYHRLARRPQLDAKSLWNYETRKQGAPSDHS